MRRAALVVVCLLQSAFTKQADTLLLREDQCDDALFVAHWTHVPKAGGTALAGLARRIACAKNPQIAHLNPCCIQDFCADHRTCEATATTCPLVLGIGRHETAMSRLVDVPCCAREWYLATVASFMRYSLKLSKPPGPHTNDTLRKLRSTSTRTASSVRDFRALVYVVTRPWNRSWQNQTCAGRSTFPRSTTSAGASRRGTCC